MTDWCTPIAGLDILQRWRAAAKARDQLRGTYMRTPTAGLIAIRYPTGRSASQAVLRARHSRAGMIGCHNHDGEQECHTLPPVPTLIVIVRAQHGSALALAFTCETRRHLTRRRPSHPLHSANHKTQKSQDLDSPGTADPWPLDGSQCPSGPDPCADSCSPPSPGATEAGPGSGRLQI